MRPFSDRRNDPGIACSLQDSPDSLFPSLLGDGSAASAVKSWPSINHM